MQQTVNPNPMETILKICKILDNNIQIRIQTPTYP